MVEEKDIYLGTVKRLLSVSLPEEEIIRSLTGMGLSEAEARKLINEAKKAKPAKPKVEEITTEEELEALIAGEAEKRKKPRAAAKPVEKKKVEFTPEELLYGTPGKEVPGENEEEMPSEEFEAMAEEIMPGEEQPEEKPLSRKEARPVVKPKPATGEEALWESGIIATVNQKLEDMDAKSKEFSEQIESKLNKELQRITVLFDSQKTLLLTKINTAFDQKMNEIKRMTSDFDEALARMQEAKRLNEGIVEKVDEKITELDEMRSELMDKVNETLLKNRSETQAVLQKSLEELKNSRKMISESLALESKIVQGMLSDTEKKYNEFISEKKADLAGFTEMVNEVKKKKVKLEELSIDIDKRLKELDVLNSKLEEKEIELEKTLNAKTAEQKQKALKLIQDEGQKFIQETKGVVERRSNELQSLIAKRLDEINANIAEMINAEEKRFVDKINLFLGQKTTDLEAAVEKKMDELSNVEKVFSKDFNELTERLTQREIQARKMFSSVPVFSLVTSIALILAMFLAGFPPQLFLFGLVLSILFLLFGVATLLLFVVKKPSQTS
jgi:hypothetical protein